MVFQKQPNHYALLDLDDLREAATPEQIRKAYYKCALEHHPDKHAAEILAEPNEVARAAKKEKIDTYFKCIQAAYDVLKDPVHRQCYDSGRDHNSDSYYDDHDDEDKEDEIPCDCAPGEFFIVFGAAFYRNARWSEKQPVMGLGGEGTPIENVGKFYEFWSNFKSNRDFKRDRDRDCLRMKRLTRYAYDRDPRILKRKKEEKAEKEKQKRAKRLREEEAARAAEAERKRREEEEKRAAEAALEQKKVKEKERKLLKKERSRFRTLSLGLGLHNLEKDDVDRLCVRLDFEKVREMCERIKGGKDEGLVEELVKIVREIKREEDEKKKSSTKQNEQNNENANGDNAITEDRPWGKEEIELLRKGMVKFPKGTPRRWEVISVFIGTGRSVEEVLKAMKNVLLKKPDDSKAFDSFLEKRKPSISIDSPLTTRIEVEGVSIPSSSTSTPEGDARAASGSSSSSSEEDGDVWSVEQERALIQALKTVPKELSGGARWKWVAAAVPANKTANQCKKKLALFRENMRSKIQNSA